ncbi:MAG TPA: hypothetical protein PLD79_03710, partial [Halothiobacillus sp.]|nr:hypothetical protein [Halothiobacillus sp.]
GCARRLIRADETFPPSPHCRRRGFNPDTVPDAMEPVKSEAAAVRCASVAFWGVPRADGAFRMGLCPPLSGINPLRTPHGRGHLTAYPFKLTVHAQATWQHAAGVVRWVRETGQP